MDAPVYTWIWKSLTLGTPAEVAGVQPERAVLHVAAAAAHGVDALVAQLGVGRRAPHLELPLLPVLGAPSARFAAFVPRVPRDTCLSWATRKRGADRNDIYHQRLGFGYRRACVHVTIHLKTCIDTTIVHVVLGWGAAAG